MDKKTMPILLLIVGLVVGLVAGWLLFSGAFSSTGNAYLTNKSSGETPSGLGVACSDTDGGQNFSLKGRFSTPNTPNGQYSGEDTCRTPYSLTEYYCSGNSAASVDRFCNCENGACTNRQLPFPATCTDSDKGIEPNTVGIASGYEINSGRYIDKAEDQCWEYNNQSFVGENYCTPYPNFYPGETDSEAVSLIWVACSEGTWCKNGACIPKNN